MDKPRDDGENSVDVECLVVRLVSERVTGSWKSVWKTIWSSALPVCPRMPPLSPYELVALLPVLERRLQAFVVVRVLGPQRA